MPAPDATWRVYLREWLTVYTSDQLEVPGMAECKAHFAEKYEGRVRPDDMRWRGASGFRPQRYCLQLNLWNLKGEFKDEADAVLRLAEHAGLEEKPRVVPRGSAEEQALLEYGKRKLPDAG